MTGKPERREQGSDVLGGPEPDEQRTDVMGGSEPGGDAMSDEDPRQQQARQQQRAERPE